MTRADACLGSGMARKGRMKSNIQDLQIIIKHYLEKHGFERFAPKTVLFDMDGVLYDSMPMHAIAWQRSMAHYGITMTSDDAYATEGARGIDTIREMVRRQQGRDISLDEAQVMYDLKSKTFHELGVAPVFPGVIDLMRKITDCGMTVGVVTGSGQRPLIGRLLDDFGEFLDECHITTAYDVDRGKPLPDPYLMGLQKAGGLQPWEGIVVENAPLGVQAGAAARCLTVAVNSGPLPDAVLANAGADIVLKKMTQLAEQWQQLTTV